MVTLTQKPPPKVEDVEIDEVKEFPVTKGVYLLRGSCKQRLKYEIEYGLKRGTTDNSYLIQASDKSSTSLIDVPFLAYKDEYDKYLDENHVHNEHALAAAVKCLDQLTPINQISHIIITHLGPNAIPTLMAVLSKAFHGRSSESELKIVLSNPALQLLTSAAEKEEEHQKLLHQAKIVTAKHEQSIQIAEGKELQLFLTPTPRWPDLMCVYYPSTKLFFTSKLFSAHVAPSLAIQEGGTTAFDVGGWGEYSPDWRYFFDCMVAPVAKQARAALDKLNISVTRSQSTSSAVGILQQLVQAFSSQAGDKGPEVKVWAICPRHGPVVKTALSQLVREYGAWIKEQLQQASSSTVAVLYASAYGNTAALAQAISRGILKTGVAVQTLNLETADVEDVNSVLKDAKAFVIGSPTLGGHMPTQVQVALGTILNEVQASEVPCGVFGSFGWSGEAVDEMDQRLKDAGFNFGFKSIRVKFKPTAKDLQLCEESGRAMAQLVIKRRKSAQLQVGGGGGKAALASAPQLAMGRVVGSLCVVTASDEDASSAMLASWVSQASFDPPGITVAVKKDRAIDDFLVGGGKFCISIVAEGKDRVVMRAMTKRFGPGEDRMASLETFTSPASNCLVLKDANAYLDCEVVSRMEAGDHWVVYSKVTDGKVVQDDALTAVHHRKVGNHY